MGFVQGAHNGNTVNDNNIPAIFSVAITSGNSVAGMVAWDDHLTGATITSITDDKSNTYNLETKKRDATNTYCGQAFSLGNITNAPATITVHFSDANASARVICAAEYSGIIAAADPRDGHGGQFQTTPGTTADAISSGSGNCATTFDGDIIVGLSVCTSVVNVVSTSGTGFSVIRVFDNTTNCPWMGIEDQTQAVHSATTVATFTQAANNNQITFAIALKVPGVATPTSFGAVQSSDQQFRRQEFRLGKKVQEDNSFTWSVRPATGEFLTTFISAMQPSDQVRKVRPPQPPPFDFNIEVADAPFVGRLLTTAAVQPSDQPRKVRPSQPPPFDFNIDAADAPFVPLPFTTAAVQPADQPRKVRPAPFDNDQDGADALFVSSAATVTPSIDASIQPQDQGFRRIEFKRPPDDGFAAPATIASGEFLTSFISQWIGSDQLRRAYRVTIDSSVPYSFVPVVGTPAFDAIIQQPYQQIRRVEFKREPDDGFAAPATIASGEFLQSFISQWLNSDQLKRQYKFTLDLSVPYAQTPIVGTPTFDAIAQPSDAPKKPFRIFLARPDADPIFLPSTIFVQWLASDQLRRPYRITLDLSAPFVFRPPVATPFTFEAEQASDLRYRPYRYVQQDNAFSAPVTIASGEFLASFISQWLNQDQLRRQYRITPDRLAPYALFPPPSVPTPSSVAAVQPSDLRYRPYRYVQQDYGFVQPIGIARGEFLQSFISQWLNQDQARRQYRIILDLSVPYALVPTAVSGIAAFVQSSDLRYRPYKYVNQDNAFATITLTVADQFPLWPDWAKWRTSYRILIVGPDHIVRKR